MGDLTRILNRPSGKRTVIYASRLMKGYEVKAACEAFKAQEAIRPTTQRILEETR